MRILVDYRPALRARSGVGEYIHQLAMHLASGPDGDSLTLFTSSWKDRPDAALGAGAPRLRVSDHRIPVGLLNLAWHNLEWPPVEWMVAADHDVVVSPHPLLLPARRAARVVMVHDLDFLDHPERTRREVRRDYARLVASHAGRADRILVPSQYTAGEVRRRLAIPAERVRVCPPGVPAWPQPVAAQVALDGFVLFMGTLEPRKNVGGLLEAYRRLRARRPGTPRLVLAGAAGPEAAPWLEAIGRPPLAGGVDHLGYVPASQRQQVYHGARVLVLPSFDEGFGLPALEAMSLGVPVVAADRGALPEVVGDAGLLVSPDDPEALSSALERVLGDDVLARSLSMRGRERAGRFNWRDTARAARAAFEEAIDARAHRN